MFQLLLLGILLVLFMDEGDRVQPSKYIRNCNKCEYFDGYKCHGGMKICWKFNVLLTNRSCSTEHFYFNERSTGRYLFRYTKLSCRSCEEGMYQIFHDLLKETYCCSEEDFCNEGKTNID
uniref:Prostate and testis expressed 2 n=1 Tax=Loxodonta africana TaxID=9785 RepID=G3U2M4_LOXAF